MNFESINLGQIDQEPILPKIRQPEKAQRPERLYRAFTVHPNELSLERLREPLVQGMENEEDPTKSHDGNEAGVYMSTNPRMVEYAYAHTSVNNNHIDTPRYKSNYGIMNFINLPCCGIVVDIDTNGLDIRQPKITEALQGVYNNGFQGDEWIADSIPPSHYRIKKLVLSNEANNRENFTIDTTGFDDEKLEEAMNTIKAAYEQKREEALKFKSYLETLTEQERLSSLLMRKWKQQM